jgi:RNA polymerase sigma factor (sigma-70 family)
MYIDFNKYLINNTKPNIYQNENSELNNALHDLINKLPEIQRTVFLMKTIQNYKTEEICKELGVSKTTFWKIVHEARLKLINGLKDKN